MFLERSCSNPSFVEPTERVLDALFLVTEQGRFPLVSPLAAQRGREGIICALGEALTPHIVTDLVYLSARDPLQHNGRTDARTLRAQVDTPLLFALEEHHRGLHRLTEHLRRQSREFFTPVRSALTAPLRDAFRASVHDVFVHREAPFELQSLWWGIECAIEYFIVAAASGDGRSARRLAPLIARFPRVIPFATKRGESNVWLVLCGPPRA